MPPVGLWTQVAGRSRERIKSANPPEKKVAVTSGGVHSGKEGCWSVAEVEDEVAKATSEIRPPLDGDLFHNVQCQRSDVPKTV